MAPPHPLSRALILWTALLALAVIVAFQVGLGVFNVMSNLPLAVAVAHNLVAALLLASLVRVNVSLRRTR